MVKPTGQRYGGISLTLLLFLMLFSFDLHAQCPVYPWQPTELSFRTTTLSNIELGIFNNGSLGWDAQPLAGAGYYRAARDFVGFGSGSLWFACMKDERKLVSANNVIYCSKYTSPTEPSVRYKNSFVPGLIGDPKAGADTAFAGAGWRYYDDPNYIVYVSTDYDGNGVDVSGYNFPDWPVRLVDGKETYVSNPLERKHYPPVYQSDQELFTVYKDTDTRSDPEYHGRFANPDTFEIPIGVEVHQHCYSWSPSHGILKNALAFTFEIHNKSGKTLSQCYAGSNLTARITANSVGIPQQRMFVGFYAADSSRNFVLKYNPDPILRYPLPPYILCSGLTVVQSPLGDAGKTLGLTIFKQLQEGGPYSGRARYDRIQQDPKIGPNYFGSSYWYEGDLHATGPFKMAGGDTVRVTTALMLAEGLDNLLLLDDMVKRVFNHHFLPPSPPDAPTWNLDAADGGTIIRWDRTAESSVDPIVPDSLGKPFLGYRLYRARVAKGPFLLIKEWQVGRDSIVHEYLDRGQDGKDTILSTRSGLANNIPFYYKLTAYDEGAPALELPPMESVSEVKSISLSGDPSSPYALDNIRIVPNPYIVTHAAQQSIDHPKLFFNYLPEECTIRIYTVALELVAELHHHGGSAEEWDLRTQGGQQVASQLLIAQIETPQGTAVVKKFAVVLAE